MYSDDGNQNIQCLHESPPIEEPSKASYDLALIVIDSAAFSYQQSDLKIFCRLTVLGSTPFVFLDRELGDLRSNFGDASDFTTAKYLLSPRTKYSPFNQRRFISRALRVSKQLGVAASTPIEKTS